MAKADMLGKKLQKIMGEALPGKQIHYNKAQQVLSADWEPLAKIVVKARDSFFLEWNGPVVTKMEVNKAEITKLFLEDGFSGDNIARSV